MKFWKRQNDGTGKCLVSLLWKIGEVGLCDHLRQMRDKPLSCKVGEGWFWKRKGENSLIAGAFLTTSGGVYIETLRI